MLHADPHSPPAGPPRVPVFYCPCCERTLYCELPGFLAQLRAEWPDCCGAEMTFFVGVDRHGREIRHPAPGFAPA